MLGWINNNKAIFGTFLIIAIFSGYMYLKNNSIERYGIITIAKVINYEGDADGESLYLDIYIGDSVYSTVTNQGCSGHCVGSYYFVKVLRNSPSDVIFYMDEKVPDCMLNKKIPVNGWQKIPGCQ